MNLTKLGWGQTTVQTAHKVFELRNPVRPNIIIAPHPDDELIGCYSQVILGRIDKVIFVESMPYVRMEEAETVCHRFGMECEFLGSQIERLCNLSQDATYYVTSPGDTHNLHQLVGRLMLWTYPHVIVYSISMQDWFVKEVPDPEAKRKLLDECYPSQAYLWEHDARYYLFEGQCMLL